MARIVFQVAHALNCPTTNDSELAECLRNQDVDTLLRVKIHKPKYVPAYAPLIDHAVIPDKPFNLMENVQLFGRYDSEFPPANDAGNNVLFDPIVAPAHRLCNLERSLSRACNGKLYIKRFAYRVICI